MDFFILCNASHDRAISSAFLGAVERGIGHLQELAGRVVRPRAGRDASDTYGYFQLARFRLNWRPNDSVAQAFGLFLCLRVVTIRQQN